MPDVNESAKPARKALLVGINDFQYLPGAKLNGCVNDVDDMAALLVDVLGYAPTDIVKLTNAQATKANIMTALQTIVVAAKAGRVNQITFAWSSHGTQVPDKNRDETDRADEAFAPYDLMPQGKAWHPDHIITDDELNKLFSTLPAHVLLEVFLDTCHSGTGLRDDDLHAPKPRFIKPPSQEPFEKIPKREGYTLKGDLGAIAKSHVLWSGCRSDQTSADAFINGRYNGAFTFAFCKVMRESGGTLPREDVMTKLRAELQGKYEQIPQLELDATNRRRVVGAFG